MSQVTHVKLEELSVLKLYEHYGALERSLPLLTPDSQELAKAELEACANLRSEKIDRIYYAMANHEDALERIKKESDLIQLIKRVIVETSPEENIPTQEEAKLYLGYLIKYKDETERILFMLKSNFRL